MVVQEAVVGVINSVARAKDIRTKGIVSKMRILVAVLFTSWILPVVAAVLPDERVDVLGHQYEGGGIRVAGPSILVRKNIGSSVSVSANYYVDVVSSASIDVMASASRYSEEREQQSIGVDYMHDRTTFSLGYTTSDENDYHAKSYNLGVSQTFFGDLSTINFGFRFGQDLVGKNKKVAGSLEGIPDPDFRVMEKQSRSYHLDFSQILTRNLIAELSLESGTEACVNLLEGESCLNNPYRSYIYVDGSSGFRTAAAEKYPLTHNSDAVSLRAIYHLPFSASIRADVRNFSDSWGIKAENAEVRYVHDFKKNFLLELKYRVYSQTGADFYNDLFAYKDAKNFMARDKELSTFASQTIGLGLTYKLPWILPGIEKSTVNLYWDHMKIDYDNFRDYAHFATPKDAVYKVGEEPLYSLDADVIRLYLSVWF